MSHRSGLRRFTILAMGVLLAMACMASGTKTYAQTAIDNSVKLDPFDPVPQIGFHHGEDGDCYDPCGYHHCYRDCGYHRGCERDCHGRCERDCRPGDRAYENPYARYNHQADMYEVLLHVYMDQLRWYDDRYRGGWRHEPWPDGDHHDGHDGDHHDGDGHDGDRHDDHAGDHHDGDHDAHDDGHHDGDGHDDHHHDGQWQDSDGNWHDGPPPDGYGH